MRNLGLIITFCLASIALPSNGFALGLGEIEVNSFLNQPLKAEIEVISARAGEIDDLLVSLASRDAFTRAGLSRPSHLSELRFFVQKSDEGDEAVILVTTKSAIKEPFLNFLVEADWSKGRLLKEFTVLLDPPFYADSAAPAEPSPPKQTGPVIETPVASENGDTPSVISEQQNTTEPIATTQPIATTDPVTTFEPIAAVEPLALTETDQSDDAGDQPSEDEYIAEDADITFDGEVEIFKGDTLWSLAARFKDSKHSMDQLMLAIQRTNSEAFGDDNINYLKIGAVLRAPDADELNLLSKQEAHAQVLEQNGLWDDYVARVTGTTSAAMADDDGSTDVTDSSAVEMGDLSLLAPGDGDSDTTGSQGDGEDTNELMKQLAFAEEELEASRVANLELESKIADLEARLNKFEELQKMVEIEDDSLAQLQANQAAEQAASDEIVTQDAEEASDETVTQDAETSDETATQDAGSSEEDLVEDLLAEEATAELEASDAIAESDLIEESVEEETSVTPPAPVVVTEPVQDSGSILDDIIPADILDMIPMDFLDYLPPMDSVIQDPVMLGTLGGIVVLLLVLILYRRSKRSSEDGEEAGITVSDPDGAVFEEDLTPVGLAADGGVDDETNIHVPDEDDLIQPTHTEAIEPTQSGLPPSGEAEEDDFMATSVLSKGDMEEMPAQEPAASEQDDVLDEVDVYLAYGLYDNAEELLNQNLESNPDRADYRSKLLDTYFATKNTDEFVKQAETLKSMGSVGDRYWDRVQVMGYELAPDNALFSGGKDSTLTPADLGVSKPESADFDLGAEEDDTKFSITDFNLGEESDDLEAIQTVADSQAGNEFDATAQLAEQPDLDNVEDINLPEQAELSESEEELITDISDLDFKFSADDEADAEGMDFELLDELDLGDSDGLGQVDEPLEATVAVDVPDDLSSLKGLGDPGEDDSTSEVDLPGSAAEKTDSTAILGAVDFPPTAGDDIDLGLDDTHTQQQSQGGDDGGDELKIDLEDEDLGFDGDDDKISMDFEDSLVMDVDLDMDRDGPKTNTFAPGDFDDPDEISSDKTDFDEIDFDDISGLMLPDDVDEISTKLDLARAFIDMGDAEGARSSLNEVIAEGNDAQKTEAQSLLGQL